MICNLLWVRSAKCQTNCKELEINLKGESAERAIYEIRSKNTIHNISRKCRYCLTCRSAQSSLINHSGLSCPASAAGLTSVGKGFANCVCCFNKIFFFWSLPSRRIFNIPGVARSKSERGGITVSPWRCFFFLPAAKTKKNFSVNSYYHCLICVLCIAAKCS